ncbi:MAG: family 43 glycosylhydrolase [Chitinispirillaceae bacterium]|nr:family 43 glycosylhydrolase [Chitinispirillaceae bacterium]
MGIRSFLWQSGTVATFFISTGYSENPVVQTLYTADPAPMVYNDTVFLYTGHDEDSPAEYFDMKEWRCYSSVDLANWTDQGSPLNVTTFSWAQCNAWAGQCVHRNGRFYFYAPVIPKEPSPTSEGSPQAIGVGVAMNPAGPFTDAIGRPLLVHPTCCYIDPTVFVDDDGQAYLYWGLTRLFMVKLNEDMISYSGDITEIPLTKETFGSAYAEGPWLYQRNGRYYMLYAGTGTVPGMEDIRYSTAPGPGGPWVYGGIIMNTQGLTRAQPCTSWTNHPAVFDYRGGSYFAYHNAGLPGGAGFKRSVCIEQFFWNADGTIPLIDMTLEGPPQIGHLNPYDTTEAETFSRVSGIATVPCSEGGMYVDSIHNGDWIKVEGVDFDAGAVSFEARVASAGNGGSIELYLDTVSGPPGGTCKITGTGGWQTWVTRSCSLSGAEGVHDLFLKFTGGSGELFNFNWWKFTPDPATGISDAAGKKKLFPTMVTVAMERTRLLRISFSSEVTARQVRISLFDASGRRVAVLVAAKMQGRSVSFLLDGAEVHAGAYIVRVSTDNGCLFTKMIVLY